MSMDLTTKINAAIEVADGDGILLCLQESGQNTGEVLLQLARQRLAQGQAESAVFLLKLLLPTVSEDSVRKQLTISFGQICAQMDFLVEARACYLLLGLDIDLIPAVLETYGQDFDGLVDYLAECAVCLPQFRITGSISEHLDLHIAEYLSGNDVACRRRELREKNMACLEQHCRPETVLVLRELAEYVADDSCLLVAGHMLEKNAGVWHFSSRDALAQLSQQDRFHLDHPEVVAIKCAALQYLWCCVHGHSVEKALFFSKGRYVVINFRLLTAGLSAFSLAPLFESNFRFNFIDSRDLTLAWRRYFSGTSCLPPTQCLWLGDSGFESEFQKVLQTLLIDFRQSLASSEQAIRSYYGDYVFPSQGKVKILFLTSIFTTYLQFSIRDLAWGFEQIGCETMMLKEAAWDGEGLRNEYVQGVIASFKPDIIFTIDHLRYEFGFIIPETLPFITWVQDPLPCLKLLPKGHRWSKQDYVVGYSDGMTSMLSALPVYKGCNLSVLSVGVNPTNYYPLPECPSKYDVTYITHLVEPTWSLLSLRAGKSNKEWPDRLDRKLLCAMLDEFDRISLPELSLILQGDQQDRQEMRRVAERVCGEIQLALISSRFDLLRIHSLDVEKEGHLTSLGRHLIWLMKVKPVRYLQEHGIDIHVFGRGWENVPGLEGCIHPPVNNGEDLNRLINETRINLNYNPSVTMHMKAPEIIAAKGFMLSPRHVEDKMPITHFFEEDQEVILCDNEKDLLAKVTFYLADETSRGAIVDRAYTRLLETLTMDRIAQSFRDILVS